MNETLRHLNKQRRAVERERRRIERLINDNQLASPTMYAWSKRLLGQLERDAIALEGEIHANGGTTEKRRWARLKKA